MTDRESVIIGLQNCKPSWFTVEKCSDDSCPYNRFGHEDGGCVDHLIDDALELLKEQEPVEPSIDVDTYVCPNCGHRLEHQGMLGDNVIFDERYNFCPACGKKMKWDEL